MLNDILEEEKKAADLIRDAHSSANEIVKNAEAKATENERKSAIENRSLFQQILEKRRSDIELELQGRKNVLPADMLSSLTVSGSRMTQAVEIIVEGILHGDR
ncbi:MAG: hypothetical protein QM308_06050 [Bacillota bacterium]|nr:hypothetical protein [Bacillota bacterium]